MDTAPGSQDRAALGVALGRRLVAALAIVVVTSGAFAFVGSLDREDPTEPVAAGDPGADGPDVEADPEVTPSAPDESTDGAGPATDGEANEDPEPDESTGEPEPELTAEPTAEPDPEPTAEPDSEPTAEPEPEASEPPDPSPSLAPSDISIQVLDGYKADGGAAMRGVSEDLRGQGYRVVAENQALDYTVTTVLWTEGNEAAARQVAAAIGAGDVRPQPGNLSESVTVHVVVGADRG